MRLNLNHFAVVAVLAAGVQGAITGVGKLTGTYLATANSTIAITFLTSITINAVEDYSVVFGVYPASQAVSGALIGTRWHNVDLVAAGYVTTGGGNFTLSKLPLTSKFFPSLLTPTPYVIAAAVTSGTGSASGVGGLEASVVVYNLPVNVTTGVFTTGL